MILRDTLKTFQVRLSAQIYILIRYTHGTLEYRSEFGSKKIMEKTAL